MKDQNSEHFICGGKRDERAEERRKVCIKRFRKSASLSRTLDRMWEKPERRGFSFSVRHRRRS